MREQRSWPEGRRAGDGMDAGGRATQEQLPDARSKREVPKRKRHPTWRLPLFYGQQVREPRPGFSIGLLSVRKGGPTSGNRSCVASTPASMPSPCRLPLRGLSSPTHRRTGAPGRVAGHPGPHSVRNRCAAAGPNAVAPCASGPRNDCRLPANSRQSPV
jgi:hypothetical protein